MRRLMVEPDAAPAGGGRNAPPKPPGGAGTARGTLRSPARSSLTAVRQRPTRGSAGTADPKGAARAKPEAGRDATQKARARGRKENVRK